MHELVGGQWVEVASREPEPVVESLVTPAAPEPAPEQSPLPAEAGAASTQVAATEVLDDPDDDPKLDLPIYRRFDAGDAEETAAPPGWPRSLVHRRDATG
jgi:hypothetical protein